MNNISVRRVMVQTIDAEGNPVDKPSYGVMAADDFAQAYNDTFDSLEELNAKVAETGCLLDVVLESGVFEDVDSSLIGSNNYYGPIKTIDYNPKS